VPAVVLITVIVSLPKDCHFFCLPNKRNGRKKNAPRADPIDR
jgi:hypothetical protein